MSSQDTTTFATEQLLELLLQLKKTTPAAAKQILNDQPSIAYALITLMVSMNAINIEVFHKVLADYSAIAATAQPTAGPAAVPTPAPVPVPAIPPHLQPQAQYRNMTPPTIPTAYPNGNSTSQPYSYGQPHPPPQQVGGPGYAGYTQSGYPGAYPPYSAQQSSPTPPTNATPALPETLAHIPEDQKAIIMRVLSMTPEQINVLPPAERSTYIQLRATLGVPTG
ncbi:hypothetical protein M378DRAFT_207180 [Amanita muscaria Koide BX008]|uniref:Cleavage stimulation factor subunit 2 hinge domain-containing protein n=1 Tax=Amanita muscaria (strain Koide BX008) TaxID=946122 RepID=A0A0C2XNT6_AMAMK|nr:hypothetical protein M378DRAFT_207180 [Amanita muscaria Koide BX008]